MKLLLKMVSHFSLIAIYVFGFRSIYGEVFEFTTMNVSNWFCCYQGKESKILFSSGEKIKRFGEFWVPGMRFSKVIGVKLFSICGLATISYWLLVKSLTQLKVYSSPLSKGSRYIGYYFIFY